MDKLTTQKKIELKDITSDIDVQEEITIFHKLKVNAVIAAVDFVANKGTASFY